MNFIFLALFTEYFNRCLAEEQKKNQNRNNTGQSPQRADSKHTGWKPLLEQLINYSK